MILDPLGSFLLWLGVKACKKAKGSGWKITTVVKLYSNSPWNFEMPENLREIAQTEFLAMEQIQTLAALETSGTLERTLGDNR